MMMFYVNKLPKNGAVCTELPSKQKTLTVWAATLTFFSDIATAVIYGHVQKAKA